MMQTEKVREQIVAIIADHLKIDKDRVLNESTLESLGADSLDQVEVVMQVEEAFDIEIPDDAVERINTVGGLIAYVTEQIK